MPNFSSLAGLKVAEKFVWGVGWGGHFHVKPNGNVEFEVVLHCRWSCDNK